jgi:tetratricopeptide (TPR) repeat protein
MPQFAEVHMNLGLVYQLQKRIPDAMGEFRRALAIKPGLAGANFFLGVNYCNLGEGAQAIPFLKAAANEEPKRSDIWSWLAIAQEMSGDIRGEVATLKHALSLEPKDVDLLYLLGHAFERLGKKEVADLEKAAPGSSWSEQLLGESYSSSNRWSYAVIRFQNAIASSTARPGLHVGLGEVFLRAGKFRQAEQEFEEELRVDSHSLRAIVRRGEVKLINGDVDGALANWTQAIAIDRTRTEHILAIRETGFGDAALEQLPDAVKATLQKLAPQIQANNSQAAHLALTFIAAQNENFPEGSRNRSDSGLRDENLPSRNCAPKEVREALVRERYSANAHCFSSLLTAQSPADLRLRVAGVLYEIGDYDAALEAIKGLAPKDRASSPAFYWRARCYEKLAMAAYLRLYQTDANSYRVHQLMGDLETARGDDKKALEEYRAAIALRPSVPNLHYSLGHLLWKNLQTAEARVELEKELEINPRHLGALHDLGDTYLLEHEPEKAMPYLQRAVAIDAGDPDLHRDLGTGYSEMKEYRKAEAEFKLAVAGDRDGSVHYKLGRVYRALGEKEKADREFTLSSELNRESHSKLEKQADRLKQIEDAPESP